MNSKHTTGPWFIAANPHPKATHPRAAEFVSNTHRYVATSPDIEDECGEVCAEIVAQTFDGPNQAGNAALLAAAPELLAALETIAAGKTVDGDGNGLGTVAIDFDAAKAIARAAIAKAKGESETPKIERK